MITRITPSPRKLAVTAAASNARAALAQSNSERARRAARIAAQKAAVTQDNDLSN